MNGSIIREYWIKAKTKTAMQISSPVPSCVVSGILVLKHLDGSTLTASNIIFSRTACTPEMLHSPGISILVSPLQTRLHFHSFIQWPLMASALSGPSCRDAHATCSLVSVGLCNHKGRIHDLSGTSLNKNTTCQDRGMRI